MRTRALQRLAALLWVLAALARRLALRASATARAWWPWRSSRRALRRSLRARTLRRLAWRALLVQRPAPLALPAPPLTLPGPEAQRPRPRRCPPAPRRPCDRSLRSPGRRRAAGRGRFGVAAAHPRVPGLRARFGVFPVVRDGGRRSRGPRRRRWRRRRRIAPRRRRSGRSGPAPTRRGSIWPAMAPGARASWERKKTSGLPAAQREGPRAVQAVGAAWSSRVTRRRSRVVGGRAVLAAGDADRRRLPRPRFGVVEVGLRRPAAFIAGEVPPRFEQQVAAVGARARGRSALACERHVFQVGFAAPWR